jgi:hypothetical protein
MSAARTITARIALAALLVLACGPAAGQSFSHTAPADPTLSGRDVTSIVRELGTLMATGYVDSLRGLEVERMLLAGMKAGRYRKLDRPRPLIARLVADVQSVIADGHFNILYFPPEAPGFNWTSSADGPRDPKQELEKERARLRGSNFGVAGAEVLEGNIGWLTIARFDAPLELFREPLAAAFNLLRNTDALIIDLRRNPGGNPECVQLAFSYFLDGPERLATTRYTRSRNQREEYRTFADPGGPRYLGRPVYVLVGPATASGAEMFSYQMQNERKATIVGGRTVGGAHSFDTYKIGTPRIGNVMVLLPDARMIDALTNSDWEGKGVEPDVDVPGDQAPTAAIRLALDSLAAGATSEEARTRYRNQLEKMSFMAAHGAPGVAELEKYAGTFGIRRVSVDAGRLTMQREGGPRVELEAVAEDTFEVNVNMSPKPRVRFEMAGGRARALVLNQNGGEERVERDR